MCIRDRNITITFHGEYKNYENLLKKININFLNSSTIVHKQNTEEFFVVICQNQTCSNKLTNIKEIEDYLKENRIN